MKRGLFLLLLVINGCLMGWLAWGRRGPVILAAETQKLEATKKDASLTGEETQPKSVGRIVAPRTPFQRIYSEDLERFAGNLRRIGCPELTIKEILTIQLHTMHREQEEKFRPLPADHVPYGWSSATSEARLLNRRWEAAELAKRESAELSAAIGYDAKMEIPLYAMRNSEVQFENRLKRLSPAQQSQARVANDQYWAGVQALLDRTKGFWLPEDAQELEALKQTRRRVLAFVDQ
jgi:hypothetical protein